MDEELGESVMLESGSITASVTLLAVSKLVFRYVKTDKLNAIRTSCH